MFRKWLNELSYEIHKIRSRRRLESFYRAGLVIRAIFEKRFIARLLTIPPSFSPRNSAIRWLFSTERKTLKRISLYSFFFKDRETTRVVVFRVVHEHKNTFAERNSLTTCVHISPLSLYNRNKVEYIVWNGIKNAAKRSHRIYLTIWLPNECNCLIVV